MTITELVEALDKIEAEVHETKEYSFPADRVTLKDGRKYWKIDIGTSGAWMVEKATGEIYNIKAYGVVDRNKKVKSDIGNLDTVDPKIMHAKRYNYLR